MSFGVPCVSFDCPSGPRDIIRNSENGYLINCYDRDVFPFTNSFGYSILGSVSTELARLIGIPVVYLSNYFSQDVLKITYGTGFNFFAETYINGI